MVYFWFDLTTSGIVVIIIGQPVHMNCLAEWLASPQQPSSSCMSCRTPLPLLQATFRLPPLAVSAAANDDENENVSDDDSTNSHNLRSPDYDDDDDLDMDMASSPYDAGSSPHYSSYSETHSNSEGDDTESNERRAVELTAACMKTPV